MSTTSDLVLGNLGLVGAAAKPWLRPDTPPDVRDEIYAAGRLGLVEAAACYDPAKGVFSSWAWRFICSQIRELIRQEQYPLMSIEQFRFRVRVLEFAKEHPAATVEEVAAAAGTTPFQAKTILGYEFPERLNRPVVPGHVVEVGELLPDTGAEVENEVVEMLSSQAVNAAVGEALDRLPVLQRQAVRDYYGFDGDAKNWVEQAVEHGTSREARRLCGKKALRNLASDRTLLAALA